MYETEKLHLEEQLTAITTELQTLAVYHESTDDWEIRFDHDDHGEADGLGGLLRILFAPEFAGAAGGDREAFLGDHFPCL